MKPQNNIYTRAHTPIYPEGARTHLGARVACGCIGIPKHPNIDCYRDSREYHDLIPDRLAEKAHHGPHRADEKGHGSFLAAKANAVAKR